MLVNNFNNLVCYQFNCAYAGIPDTEKAHLLDGTYDFIASDYWTNDTSDWKGSGDPPNGVSLLISTAAQSEDIQTYIFSDIFSDYEISVDAKGKQSHSVGVIYTRSITPNSDALIKSIGLICSNNNKSLLIGFENLTEPVQLTAGEPHTFSFVIKVSN